MRLINSTLIGYAFIGLMGCELAAEVDTTEYVYKGFHYVVRTRDKPNSSVGGNGEFSQRLYVCKNGQWEAVRQDIDKGIKFIKDHGRLQASPIGDVSDGDKCYEYPKNPKKDKIKARIVQDGDTAVVEVTGTDGFEGGD